MIVLAKISTRLSLKHNGYIAGSGDGIVTLNGKPSARHVYLLNAITMQLLRRNQSLDNGHYLFMGLDPSKQYLVIARDYKEKFEPVALDFVSPATNLTIDEQQTMWSWLAIK